MKLSLKISEILKNISASHRNISVRSRGRRTRVETAGQILEPRTLLTTIDLAALIAGQGTTIFGADEVDNSGFSVSNAGDVNGDGFDDLIIGNGVRLARRISRTLGGKENCIALRSRSEIVFGAARCGC